MQLVRLKSFEANDFNDQPKSMISKSPNCMTPDASKERIFNAQLFNQSFSADLEMQ